jgi:ubiquinone biosynthesis protein
MDLIKTGIGISKTIKNVARLREIVGVLGRNGFDEFIIKANLHNKIPGFVLRKSAIKPEGKGHYSIWRSVGFRLRNSFKELGPSFIKLGQLLASREDLFPPEFIEELKLLQNQVGPIPFSEVKKTLENNFGSYDKIFKSVDEEPIGTASIGVVHRAELVGGEKVVVKVRRPNIREALNNDFEIIRFLVAQLEKVSDEIKYLGISRVIEDFFKSIQLELNFKMEALNCNKFSQNIKNNDTKDIFRIPKIYNEYSCQEVLVMEYMDGIPFNSIKDVHNTHPELVEMIDDAVKMFIITLLADGFFHADLHGGNFFLLPDKKIGVIDFGLMGTLSKKNRTSLVAILFALVTNNYENLVYEFLDVADYDIIPDQDKLMRDIQDGMTPFIGLSAQDIDVTLLVNTIVTTLSKHQIYLPREWFIIFRALMVLDGVGKSLKIDINIFQVIEHEIKDIIGELVSKEAILEDAAWLGRDSLNSLRVLPRHIRWFLKEFSKRNYTYEIQTKEIPKYINQTNRSIIFLGLIALACTLIACGAMFVETTAIKKFEDIPVITYVFWGLGILTIIRSSIVVRFL